jgi:transcription elongation GreA/GreB family factor
MSRAFVSEAAAEANAAILPERPISTAPNLVTPRGLQRIEAEVARLQARLAEVPPDDPERPGLARDLRYWRARAGSAQPVPPVTGTPEEVGFGTRVTIRRGASTTAYRIVGEDEADPAQGLLSWTSPVAEALAGARVGEVVDVGPGRPAVTVLAIEAG